MIAVTGAVKAMTGTVKAVTGTVTDAVTAITMGRDSHAGRDRHRAAVTAAAGRPRAGGGPGLFHAGVFLPLAKQ